MTDSPPPIPDDADLRHMPSYMIDVQSLLDSDLAAFGDPAANWYAVLTWCAALHQVPAGSLPDDDAVLAYLVRLGRDVRTWKKFREKGALRGWVKHSDGRLYHPVVTKKVLELLKVSRAGRKGGLTYAANLAARKSGQVIENTKHGSDNRRGHARSDLSESSEQKLDNRREGKGTEGKVSEEVGLKAGLSDNLPVLFQPEQPPVTTKPAKKQRAPSKGLLPDDWRPSDADWKYAADRGFGAVKIDAMAEAFRNNHHGKGTMMADIAGYWRTWVGNEIKWHGVPGGAAPAQRARSTETAMVGIFDGMEDPRERDR